MKKIIKLLISSILILFTILPFLNYKVKACIANDNKRDIILINDGLQILDSGNVLFEIRYSDYSVYKTEKEQKMLYSLWNDQFELGYIELNNYKIYDISFHDVLDELPIDIFSGDIYIKVIFADVNGNYFYATKLCDNFNREYFKNAIITTEENDFLFENAFLDYTYDLRTINVKTVRSVGAPSNKLTLNSDFDLNNYCSHMNANSRDDNPIINLIPKQYFTMPCEFGDMGEAYGYYIKTVAVADNYEGYHYVSRVSVFNLTYISYLKGENICKKYIRRSINEVFNYTYVTYLKSNKIWNDYGFNPKKDSIVRYNSNINNDYRIQAYSTNITSYGGTPITHIEQETQAKADINLNGQIVNSTINNVISFFKLVVNELISLNEYVDKAYTLYSFVKECVENNMTANEARQDFTSMPESQYVDSENIDFFVNDLSISWDDSVTNRYQCVAVDYNNIYSLFADNNLFISFSDTYAIEYDENDFDSYSTIETVVSINGYDISSNVRKEYMNEIYEVVNDFGNQINKTICLNTSNNRTGFQTSVTISDTYFINTLLSRYTSGNFKMRVYRNVVSSNYDNEVVCEATYYSDYTYDNVSTMLKLYDTINGVNTNYYFCIEREGCNENISFSLTIRRGIDYNINGSNSLNFVFTNSNEVWISYQYSSNAVIGAYFISFSVLSQTGNVDTIIEVYDNYMRLVDMDDDGYFDEEADDPSLGSLTSDSPIHINNTYYIKVRYRNTYNGEAISFRPYVGLNWYSYGG